MVAVWRGEWIGCSIRAGSRLHVRRKPLVERHRHVEHVAEEQERQREAVDVGPLHVDRHLLGAALEGAELLEGRGLLDDGHVALGLAHGVAELAEIDRAAGGGGGPGERGAGRCVLVGVARRPRAA